MGAQKPPQAPASPVTTAQNQVAYGGASSNIGQVASNPFPMQAFNTFAPGMMSTTPYGFDPTQMVQGGQYIASQGQNLYGAGNQVANTAFDPQNALYNRTAQQVQDFSRASQAARGIQTTPYGAGLENQAMSDFNIDWQNQQLARQISGAGAMAGAYGAGGQQIASGNQLGAMAPQIMQQYLSGLQQVGMGAFAPQQLGAQDYSSLFGAGTQAQQNAYQQALQRYQANQQSQGAFASGIGNLVGNVGAMAFL